MRRGGGASAGASSTSVVWRVQIDDGGWVAYPPTIVAAIEAAWTAGEPKASGLKVRQHVYDIIFDRTAVAAHVQANVVWKTKRPVRREPPTAEATPAPPSKMPPVGAKVGGGADAGGKTSAPPKRKKLYVPPEHLQPATADENPLKTELRSRAEKGLKPILLSLECVPEVRAAETLPKEALLTKDTDIVKKITDSVPNASKMLYRNGPDNILKFIVSTYQVSP